MSGWSCPHHDPLTDACRRLGAACVIGRKGCVLPRKLRYAVPVEERVREAEKAAAQPPAERPPARKPR